MLAVAAVLALASQASSATIDFSTNGTGAGGVVAGGPLSSVASASSTFFPGSAAVTVSANGLGVSHFLDTQPGQIDGTFGTSEVLTITFSWAVNLFNFTLGRVDRRDDLEVSYNGAS